MLFSPDLEDPLFAAIILGAGTGGAAPSPLLNALGGYWSFETNANDVSGNDHHGSSSGTTTYVQAKFGQGAFWSGTNRVVIADHADLKLGGGRDWTVAFWARVSSPVFAGLFDKFSNSIHGLLVAAGAGGVGIQAIKADGTPAAINPSLSPGAGVLRFYAVTWDDNAKLLTCRVDTVVQTLAVPGGLAVATSLTTEFCSDRSGYGMVADGAGDELGIWSSLPGGGGCLSTALLNNLYNGGRGRTWPFADYPDPAALPGIRFVYEASPTYCFQDAAATVPCGHGDLIYTWRNRAGPGTNLVQATASLRPTLISDSGSWVARFDGIDDEISGTCAWTGTVGSASCGCKHVATATPRALWNTKPAANDGYLTFGGTVDSYPYVFRATRGAITGPFPDTTARFTATHISGASNYRLTYGVTKTSTTAWEAPSGIRLGREAGYLQGDIYGLIAAAAEWDAPTQAQVENYLMSL